GSDIGGSIRWPAFCNGVVGLRPTPGRVPAYNPSAAAHRAFASQLMAVNGPLARNVDDAELAFRAMAVPDPRDPHGVPAPLDGPDEGRILRVALFEAPAEAPVSDAATQAVRRTGEILSAAGFDVAYASPPDLARLEALWHLIALVELRAALEPLLARTRDRAVESFFRAWWAAKPAATLETYLAALQERDTLMRRWQVFMEDYPLVVLPSCPRDRLAAGRDAEGAGGAADAIDILRFQLPISVLGLPSLAVPVGTQDGLPQGVQIVSRRFREDFCFRAGRAIEAQEPPRTPIEPAA
ncbi:MAG TPA: amidase family protein, partial [Rhizomicrobium sp.]